jgi:hypothetical protein
MTGWSFFFLLNWPIEVERSECKKYIHGSEFKRPDLIEAWNLNGPEAHDTFPMSVRGGIDLHIWTTGN